MLIPYMVTIGDWMSSSNYIAVMFFMAGIKRRETIKAQELVPDT